MGLVESPLPEVRVAAGAYPPRYVVNLLGVGIALKSTIRSGIGGSAVPDSTSATGRLAGARPDCGRRCDSGIRSTTASASRPL